MIGQVTDYDAAGADNAPLADAYTIPGDTTNTNSRAPAHGYPAGEVDTGREMYTVSNHTLVINAGAGVHDDGKSEPGFRVHHTASTKHRTGTNVGRRCDNGRWMHHRDEVEASFDCNIGKFKSGFAVADAKYEIIDSAPYQLPQFFLATDNDSTTK